jgi:hypothetical protein
MTTTTAGVLVDDVDASGLCQIALIPTMSTAITATAMTSTIGNLFEESAALFMRLPYLVLLGEDKP